MVSFSRYFTTILFFSFYFKTGYIPTLHQILLSSSINYLGKFTLPSYVGTYGWQGMNVYLKNQSYPQNQIIQKVVQCATEFFFFVCPAKNIKIKIPRIIKWNTQPEPFIKLNIDGNSLGNPGLASASELLRNSSGDWISIFSLHMGITSNNIAELGAVHQGLLLAWNLGFKFIHLEIDSMRVLSRLTNTNDIPPIINPILCDCRNLMECDWTIQVYHIFREANGYADALAKRGK